MVAALTCITCSWDPFTAELSASLRDELAGLDLHLVTVGGDVGAGYRRVEEYLLGGAVDGVALLCAYDGHPLPGVLAAAGVPAVVLGRMLNPRLRLPYVDVDNVRAAEHAVRWLQDRGRVRIGTITGPQTMPAGVDRLAGYLAAVPAPVNLRRPGLIVSGDFSAQSGERAMVRLLARDPRVDAVFVASDLMALGVLRALRRAGRRVPEDVAVVGFDGLASVAELWPEPSLTTVRQPIPEMGRAVARMLAERLGGSLRSEPDPALFATHLLPGDSA